jgi:transcription elongation GreA/GreB family factor
MNQPEMTRVQEELNEATNHLRNALHFASRTEKPEIIINIASILRAIGELPKYEFALEAQKRFEERLLNIQHGDGQTL